MSLDWHEISKLVRRPAWLFDTRDIINPEEATKYGIQVWSVGNG